MATVALLVARGVAACLCVLPDIMIWDCFNQGVVLQHVCEREMVGLERSRKWNCFAKGRESSFYYIYICVCVCACVCVWTIWKDVKLLCTAAILRYVHVHLLFLLAEISNQIISFQKQGGSARLTDTAQRRHCQFVVIQSLISSAYLHQFSFLWMATG